MKPKANALLILALGLAGCGICFGQDRVNIPTHCKVGEFAYLNAIMSKVEVHGDSYELIKTGKVLSICADREKEPFQAVAYRYGSIGNVEMDRVATTSDRFTIFARSDSPHSGENVMLFKAAPYVYCVFEATAQGTGVGVTVLKSGREVLRLFSADRGRDFESEMIRIEFEAARSPIFHHIEPRDSYRTACDPRPAK